MDKETASTIVKVYAVLSWLGALFMILSAAFISTGFFGSMMMPGFMSGMGFVVGILFVVLAIFSAVVGYGLWTLQKWARIAALVMSVLQVFSFPIGTIIGGFGIYFFGFEEATKTLFGK